MSLLTFHISLACFEPFVMFLIICNQNQGMNVKLVPSRRGNRWGSKLPYQRNRPRESQTTHPTKRHVLHMMVQIQHSLADICRVHPTPCTTCSWLQHWGQSYQGMCWVSSQSLPCNTQAESRTSKIQGSWPCKQVHFHWRWGEGMILVIMSPDDYHDLLPLHSWITHSFLQVSSPPFQSMSNGGGEGINLSIDSSKTKQREVQ